MSPDFWICSLAIVIGALTHLAWDSFTHGSGWCVRHLPLLNRNFIDTPWGHIPLFKVLQHGSTLLGSAWLGVLAFRQRATLKHIPTQGWWILAGICTTSLIGALAIAMVKTGSPTNLRSVAKFVGIVGGTAALTVLWTLLGLRWKILHQQL